MIKEITKLDMLKKAQECIDNNIKLKNHVKIDIDEESNSDADLNLLVITDLPKSWEIRDEVVFSIYRCLEEIDPYVTLHFNWKYLF
jgi:hypothetical protein